MKKDYDLASTIVTFLILMQALVIILKFCDVLKCSWFIALLPLIVVISFLVISMFVMILIIIFGKDKEN